LVFLANGSVLAVALLLLAFTPITIDAPIQKSQLALLFGGFVVLLALNVVLLRRVLAPLIRLTHVMSSVDPDRPGRRLSGVEPRSVEGQALAHAFNAMLDRLENARHEAARTALAAQEAERLRRPSVPRTGTRSLRRRFVMSRTVCARASTRCAASPVSCVPRHSMTSGSSTR
jgi:two-component system sensor histidine kinase UhpB